jgi:hypothetical protein
MYLWLNIGMNDTTNAKQDIVTYIKNMLGDGMIDIELEPANYDTAIDRALRRYRQRSSNAVEESWGFFNLELNTNEYTLAPEVMQVRQVFRRSIGSRSGGGDGGSLFEPFNLAYTNTYLLSSSNMGGLATYYAFASYQKLVGKMFGSEINFSFNPATKKLTIMQRPQSQEILLLWMYNHKPDWVLYEDPYASMWIRDHALGSCKIMIGEAREKFQTIASPQGGTSLNGTALKAEGQKMLDDLELELINNKDNQQPLTFVIG